MLSVSRGLCPALYARMVEVFGDVRITNEGEEAVEGVAVRVGDRVLHVGGSNGEYYEANCPFCGDKRKRMSVNYRFASKPEAIVCFNETQCFTGERNKANRKHMYDVLIRGNPAAFITVQGSAPRDIQLPNTPPPLPGTLVDLRQLPSDHPVITYLVQQRRFSPSWLADTYGVAYVQSALSEFWPMQGRLYIPLMMRGRLVGWQGRYVGEADWKATGINKYYNLPRIRKSLMLYGYDEAIASKSPFVVVVEGVTDVWGVGPPAVSTLGCSLSDTQLQLLLQWKTIVVYYDPDTYNCRRSPGGQVQPPAMLRLLEKLLPAATAVGAIVHVVSPPAGTDPGTMSRTENWNHLVQAISNQQELS